MNFPCLVNECTNRTVGGECEQSLSRGKVVGTAYEGVITERSVCMTNVVVGAVVETDGARGAGHAGGNVGKCVCCYYCCCYSYCACRCCHQCHVLA